MLLLVSKRLALRYDRPVSHARRLLRVRPLDSHACWRGSKYLQQRAEEFAWRCHPTPTQVAEENGVALHMENDAPHESWRFEMNSRVRMSEAAPQVLAARDAELGRWLVPSSLCERTARICDLAARAQGENLDLARRLCGVAHEALRYEEGATDDETSASVALELGAGVCQDFAHLFIALCRARSVPARYVSGFGRAPGRMHAWAEVWISGAWHAFDPTHNRALDEQSVAVAIGRDFRDVRPLEGAFQASGKARAELSTFCQVRPL